MAQCPECDAIVEMEADEVEEGQLVSCPDCGTDLEVVNINPVELDFASDEEEDEDEEDGDLEEEDDDDFEEEDEDDDDFDEEEEE